jgi:ATP/maltotriose-dependent transcriptional regulator MalT
MLKNLGMAALRLGAQQEAQGYFCDALKRARLLGSNPITLTVLTSLAQYLAALGEPVRAVRLNALILHHPATYPDEQTAASEQLAAFRSDLTPDEVEAAVEHGKTLDLDQTINALLAELSRPLSTRQAQATGVPQLLADPLTERELEILHLVAQGLSNREIAGELVVSLGTVKTHIHNICGKLDAGSRTQAIARARALKLI